MELNQNWISFGVGTKTTDRAPKFRYNVIKIGEDNSHIIWKKLFSVGLE